MRTPACPRSRRVAGAVFGTPAGVSALVLATGLLYSFYWGPVVRHKSYWLPPGDMWLTFRTAHYIGWGGFSFVYSSHSLLVTLPGFPLLFTPVAMLSSALGLTESSPTWAVPHPTAWFLVAPVMMACALPMLDSVNRLAQRLGASLAARRWLMLAMAVPAWSALPKWGHPEDVLAVALFAYMLVAVIDGRWTLAGWLLGGAIAMQLFVVVLVPLVVGYLGIRRAGALLLRASVLPGFLLLVVLVPDYHHAMQALLHQPNYQTVNHPTPWLALAPRLTDHSVAAGPGRLIAVGAGLLAGLISTRVRGRPDMLLWLAGSVIAIRCLTESVMVPYYVMPATVFALLTVWSRPPWRRALATAVVIGLTVMTNYHMRAWFYWSEMTALSVAMVALAWPRSRALAVSERSPSEALLRSTQVSPAAA